MHVYALFESGSYDSHGYSFIGPFTSYEQGEQFLGTLEAYNDLNNPHGDRLVHIGWAENLTETRTSHVRVHSVYEEMEHFLDGRHVEAHQGFLESDEPYYVARREEFKRMLAECIAEKAEAERLAAIYREWGVPDLRTDKSHRYEDDGYYAETERWSKPHP